MQIRPCWRNGTDSILSKEVKQVTPKAGWQPFLKKLLDLKITTLPDMNEIAGYGQGGDGSTFSVEIATKNQYRFYSYWEPESERFNFWQTKNMVSILKIFRDEFGILDSPFDEEIRKKI